MTKTFSKLAKAGLAAFAFAALSPAGALAQTVDGDTSDGAYNSLGTWTQAGPSGFGDHGLLGMGYATDGTNVTFAVTGEIESNFNALYLIFGHSDATGVASGMALPSGSDGLSPFGSFNPTMDFEADFGVRMSADAAQAFVSIIDYRSGGNTDTFLATIANDGTPSTVSGGAFDATVIAYDDTGNLTAHTGSEGFEISIPLAALGATATSSFEALAIYGNSGGDFMSDSTIPEIAGQNGTNLAGNPDFTGIAGNQFASFTLPVELSAFSLE